MIMPKGLQIASAKRHLAQKGINPDLVDIEALSILTLAMKRTGNGLKSMLGSARNGRSLRIRKKLNRLRENQLFSKP